MKISLYYLYLSLKSFFRTHRWQGCRFETVLYAANNERYQFCLRLYLEPATVVVQKNSHLLFLILRETCLFEFQVAAFSFVYRRKSKSPFTIISHVFTCYTNPSPSPKRCYSIRVFIYSFEKRTIFKGVLYGLILHLRTVYFNTLNLIGVILHHLIFRECKVY